MYPWGIDGMVDESKCSLHSCKKWTAKNMRQHRNCKIGCPNIWWLILKFPIQIAILGIPKHRNYCFPLTSLDHGVVMKSQKVAGNVRPFCSLATACRSSSMCSRKRPWAASRRHKIHTAQQETDLRLPIMAWQRWNLSPRAPSCTACLSCCSICPWGILEKVNP